ncbi:hypothetical protein VOLCADRAFT_106936 [Volvox carteri f. nagariensis]|uniref:Uncharacterized protein n=1 Tax=Volvox carteri f. nagariensis TaxID=3068 RepID=D8UAP7_VOLCA|nr:uncharacterized protein VOLCADRAFT_106936 [Volvox carteri f. nagariensis]EFJ43142.1 hypothetical protein VOLCADRAFT_106936 [Volvox carteri f. nagariensis]|eukprot:XP_002955717.1 hypothetical protein VOLCADRAFT_106936 [Volvox carteri f. nagariensis]
MLLRSSLREAGSASLRALSRRHSTTHPHHPHRMPSPIASYHGPASKQLAVPGSEATFGSDRCHHRRVALAPLRAAEPDSLAVGAEEPETAREAIELGNKLAKAGRWEQALAVYEKALTLPGTGLKRYRDKPRLISDGERSAALFNIACCQAQLGDMRSGLVALAGCLELGYDDFAQLRRDPDLEPLRKDERFEGLLKRFERPAGVSLGGLLGGLFGGKNQRNAHSYVTAATCGSPHAAPPGMCLIRHHCVVEANMRAYNMSLYHSIGNIIEYAPHPPVKEYLCTPHLSPWRASQQAI